MADDLIGDEGRSTVDSIEEEGGGDLFSLWSGDDVAIGVAWSEKDLELVGEWFFKALAGALA